MDKLKIYYINLDSSLERNDFMQKQFMKLKWQVERFSAVNGRELDNRAIFKKLQKSNSHYTVPSPGEIGIFYSHLNLWRKIANSNDEFALILEDDVLIKQELNEYLPIILKNLKSFQMFDLSAKKGFFPVKKQRIDTQLEFVQYLTPSLGMQGRIVGKVFVQKILQKIEGYTKPIDTLLQDYYWHHLEILTSNISFIEHKTQEVGGSTIQKKKRSVMNKLKREIQRPIYRGVTHIKNLYWMYYDK